MSKLKTKEEFVNEIINDPEKIKKFPNRVGRENYANALWHLLETALPTEDIKQEILEQKGVVENGEVESESDVERGEDVVEGEFETVETQED